MKALGARPGSAAAAVALLMLLQLAMAGLLLRASGEGVSFAGIPIGGACLFRQSTGLPCPTCGMTRSVVLSLHGHLWTALRLNPAGPLWVLAVAVIAAALLWLGWRQRSARTPETQAAARRLVRVLALAHGGAVGVVLALHWIQAVLTRA
jgi:hypothetical protein